MNLADIKRRDELPQLLFITGVPGSGKSYTLDKLGSMKLKGSKQILIDLDNVKKEDIDGAFGVNVDDFVSNLKLTLSEMDNNTFVTIAGICGNYLELAYVLSFELNFELSVIVSNPKTISKAASLKMKEWIMRRSTALDNFFSAMSQATFSTHYMIDVVRDVSAVALMNGKELIILDNRVDVEVINGFHQNKN